MACLRLRLGLTALLAGAILLPASALSRPARTPPPAKQTIRLVLGKDVVYLRQDGYYVSVATSQAGLAKAKRHSRRRSPGTEPLHLTLPKSGPWSRAVLEVCGCSGGLAHLYPEVELRDRSGKTWRYELLPPDGQPEVAAGVAQLTVPGPGTLGLTLKAEPMSQAQGTARVGLGVEANLAGWELYDIAPPKPAPKLCRVTLTTDSGRAVFAQAGSLDDFAFG